MTMLPLFKKDTFNSYSWHFALNHRIACKSISINFPKSGRKNHGIEHSHPEPTHIDFIDIDFFDYLISDEVRIHFESFGFAFAI